MNTVSRLFDLLASPLNILFLCLVLGTALLFTRWKSMGRKALVAFCVIGLGLILEPVDLKLAQILEDRFPATIPDHVDGIIVLGGAINIDLSIDRQRPTFTEAAERDTELVTLMHRFPNAKIVFSGGAANPFDQVHKESDIAHQFLDQFCVDGDTVIYESQSRNTHENAVFSKALAEPLPGQVWLLVTSAVHMPRSVGSFRAVDWPVVPWPVSYQTFGNGRIDLTSHLFNTHRLLVFTNTLHEALGLVYYRLRGWSPSLFPAP